MAPALVINEEVKLAGKMTGKEEIAKRIKEKNVGVIKI
jgi:hypothetical protein